MEDTIKQFINSIKLYFYHDKQLIAKKNLGALLLISPICIVLLSVVFILIPLIFDDMELSPIYYTALFTLLALYLIGLYFDKKSYSFNQINILCIIYYILLFIITAFLSAVPYPDNRQIFVSIFIMFIPVVFILKPLTFGIIITLGEIGFIFLVLLFKTNYDVIVYDIFSTLISLIFSYIIALITINLRLKDFIVKEEYLNLSRIDKMTGLLNKKTFEIMCDDYLISNPNDSCVFLTFDLDDFKSVNDNYGHKVGDDVIEYFTNILKNSFSANDLLGRVGGDEFCVLLKNKQDIDLLTDKLNKIQLVFSQFEYQDIQVSSSVGILNITSNSKMTYKTIFEACDKILYDTKKSGKRNYNIKEI